MEHRSLVTTPLCELIQQRSWVVLAMTSFWEFAKILHQVTKKDKKPPEYIEYEKTPEYKYQ
jgi:hypothetical protein